jgi:hypothetical protein
MYSFVTYTGNGITQDFAIPFDYIATSHIEASVNGVSTPVTFPTASTARFAVPPANGATVALRRNTSRLARLVDYAASASVTEGDLDRDSRQAFFLAQEALDQGTTAPYFSTDANGSRVFNVADPVNDTDGANKRWVVAYLSSLGLGTVSGLDLTPLNNVWTGTNLFKNKVRIGDLAGNYAELDGQYVNLGGGINVSRPFYFEHLTSANYFGYGITAAVKKSGGTGLAVGAQIMGLGYGTQSEQVFGAAVEAIKGKTSTGDIIGGEFTVANFNDASAAHAKVGLDLVFKNRQDGSGRGGDATALLGDNGNATGSNKYNLWSWAMQVSSQPRSDGGATYCGWTRGIKYRNNWCDESITPAYDGSRLYYAGDLVNYGGVVYQAQDDLAAGILPAGGNVPVYWTPVWTASGTLAKAVGIDFSGVSATTAGRMSAAIKLKADLPIRWDTEELISTRYEIANGRLTFKYQNIEQFAVSMTTGDLFVKGKERVLATQSIFSAHRNTSSLFANTGWNIIPMTTAAFNDRSEFNAGTGRFTPNKEGVYLLVGQVQTEGSAPAGQSLYAAIYKNGVPEKAANVLTQAGINTAAVTAIVKANGTTDYFELGAYWTGASSVAISGEPTATFFQATRLA